MKLSDALASLNVARYEAWSPKFTARNARQAVLAFNGDVYEGLQARTLTATQLDWLQQHVCILSGLYGVLRPLDWMQPYRLEMGTRWPPSAAPTCTSSGARQIADYLNQRLAGHKTPVVVNLASQEYFKAVDRKVLKARVIDCVFEDYKGGGYKIISFHAKRARGLMARYAAQHRISHAAEAAGLRSGGLRLRPGGVRARIAWCSAARPEVAPCPKPSPPSCASGSSSRPRPATAPSPCCGR
jgi:cytoplasmic iron level regulating protein YaaA (DUF328/UPF0246 family)